MQYREKNGRMGKKSYIVPTLALLFIAPVAVGAYLAITDKPVTYNVEALKPLVIDKSSEMYKKKIEALKQEVVDDLATKCETKGLKDPDGAIVFDSNNEASIGRLQFQRKTVIHYIKKFEGRDITNHEAIAIAIDPIQATALAEKILFTEKNGWENWYNCGKKLNLATKIEFINELTK